MRVSETVTVRYVPLPHRLTDFTKFGVLLGKDWNIGMQNRIDGTPYVVGCLQVRVCFVPASKAIISLFLRPLSVGTGDSWFFLFFFQFSYSYLASALFLLAV